MSETNGTASTPKKTYKPGTLPRAGRVRSNKENLSPTKKNNRLSNVQVRKLLNHLDNGRDRLMRLEVANFAELAEVVATEIGFPVTGHQLNLAWVKDLELPTDWMKSVAQKRAYVERKKAAEVEAAQAASRMAETPKSDEWESGRRKVLGTNGGVPDDERTQVRVSRAELRQMLDDTRATADRVDSLGAAVAVLTETIVKMAEEVSATARKVEALYALWSPNPINLTGK